MVRQSTSLPHEKHLVGSLWNPVKSVGNWEYRKESQPIDLIVIHTMDGFMEGTKAWFNNPNSKVSAHYGLSVDGSELWQFVEETKACYHAGNYNANLRSIAIECADDKQPAKARSEEFYKSLATLVVEICRFHHIPIDREHIKGHKEVKTGKTCPGAISVDEVVRLAHEIHSQQVANETPRSNVEVVPQPAKPSQTVEEVKVDVTPTKEEVQPAKDVTDVLDNNTVNILNLLSDSMRLFKQKDGKEYPDMYAFVYDTILSRTHNEELMAPDSDGLPPVIVEAREYDSLYAMANSFAKVADFFGISEDERVAKDAGDIVAKKYVESQQSLLAKLTENEAGNSAGILKDQVLNTDQLSGVIDNSYGKYSQGMFAKIGAFLSRDVLDILNQIGAIIKYGAGR